jgi:hypothetical protein
VEVISTLSGARTWKNAQGEKVRILDRSAYLWKNQHRDAIEYLENQLQRLGLHSKRQTWFNGAEKRFPVNETLSQEQNQEAFDAFLERLLLNRAQEVDFRESENGISLFRRMTNLIAQDSQGYGPTLVLGAHFDTVNREAGGWRGNADPEYRASPGADDNASGIAAVLELARRFQKSPLKRLKLELHFYDGEEGTPFGLMAGSRHHLQSRSLASMQSIEWAVIVDMIGVPSSPRDWRMHYHPWGMIMPSRKSSAHFAVEVIQPGMATTAESSDSRSFRRAQIPNVLVSSLRELKPHPLHYHSDADRIEMIQWDYFFNVIDELETLIRQVDAKPLPWLQ